MDKKSTVPNKGPASEAEAAQRRQEITERIYNAILPLLGPQQARELVEVFNHRTGTMANLRPVVDQTCDVCKGPMKIEEFDKDNSNRSVVSCIKCGYSDVLQK